jgi:hypothetical protein
MDKIRIVAVHSIASAAVDWTFDNEVPVACFAFSERAPVAARRCAQRDGHSAE